MMKRTGAGTCLSTPANQEASGPDGWQSRAGRLGTEALEPNGPAPGAKNVVSR